MSQVSQFDACIARTKQTIGAIAILSEALGATDFATKAKLAEAAVNIMDAVAKSFGDKQEVFYETLEKDMQLLMKLEKLPTD